MAITLDRAPSAVTPVQVRGGYAARVVAIAATLVSLLAFAYFYSQGTILAYKDAVSHLEIARRVIDSPTPGLAQLGGVWPPLPHLLALPFVGFDQLYFTGFAGSFVSMASYVITAVLLYKIVHDLTGRTLAGVIGAAVFALNPNVLYMQATPMTELPLFVCMAGLVYGVQRWIRTDKYQYLVGAGLAGLAGTLTRYEAWVLLAAMVLVVGFTAWRKRYPGGKIEDTILAFLLFGAAGIVGWLLWNQLIFGDPFNFIGGEYAKPSLWVGADEPSLGDWPTALATYWYATIGNVTPVFAVLAAVGLVVFVVSRRAAIHTWPVLATLVPFPFFVVALYSGQRPLHVQEISSDLYNVRFGLLMILPVAVLVGYLAGVLARTSRTFAAVGSGAIVVLVFGAVALDRDGIVTLREPVDARVTGYELASDEVSAYLAGQYDGGTVLMESFGNELVLFDAGIPTGANLYEGSYRLWEPALQHPAGAKVEWVVMRGGEQPDMVYERLNGSDRLSGYDRVFGNDLYQVYRKES